MWFKRSLSLFLTLHMCKAHSKNRKVKVCFTWNHFLNVSSEKLLNVLFPRWRCHEWDLWSALARSTLPRGWKKFVEIWIRCCSPRRFVFSSKQTFSLVWNCRFLNTTSHLYSCLRMEITRSLQNNLYDTKYFQLFDNSKWCQLCAIDFLVSRWFLK